MKRTKPLRSLQEPIEDTPPLPPSPILHDATPTCRNPHCPPSSVPLSDLHETGLCSVCCPFHGDLACEDCGWDDYVFLEGDD
jgi:hypothetical protein